MLTKLFDQPKYRDFVAGRDSFLDDINHRNRLIVSDVLRGTFSHAMALVSAIYVRYEKGGHDYSHLKTMLKSCEAMIDGIFGACIDEIVRMNLENRKQNFEFTYATELAALSRVKKQKSRSRPQLRQELERHQTKVSLRPRIEYIFDKLKRSLISSIHQSAILERTTDEMVTELIKRFPKTKTLINPKRMLKPPSAFKEAAFDKPPDPEFDIIDDETWDEMLDKYMTDFVPRFRGPEDVIAGEDLATPPLNEYYAWELEQELTEDFVNQVRQGQVQAAKDQGIQDFVWIAVVDDKTDECCLWRDGLNSAQIEDMLQNERSDDECDAVVPPAHFNCRCTISPATDYLPEPPESDIGDFEDWLSS